VKITHAKKKGKAWIIVLETKEEAINLCHTFGCRNSLYLCTRAVVNEDKFQAQVYDLLLEAGVSIYD